jgi:hypothetical protein
MTPRDTKANTASENKASTTGRRAGRRRETRAQSRERTERLFSRAAVDERRKWELLSVLSELFTKGHTTAEIKDAVHNRFAAYRELLTNETVWSLLRYAAEQGLISHKPRPDIALEQRLVQDYAWLDGRASVVQTATTDVLARTAAKKLLELIQNVRRMKNAREVHVGFAGGMTLRSVARELAELLDAPQDDLPEMLVFHSMVASFKDDDFFADPNSFSTYFLATSRVKVRLVRLALPGLIEEEHYQAIQEIPSIRNMFDRRGELDIVVTSGSLWNDKRGTLREYIRAAVEQADKRGRAGSNDARDAFENAHVVGDLLWQPINEEGPVDIVLPYRITTLMKLVELPEFIDGGGSVLLVMGCSGVSGAPKSPLLRAILNLREKAHQNWVTNVVSDSPTVEGMYAPRPTRTSAAPEKPR